MEIKKNKMADLGVTQKTLNYHNLATTGNYALKFWVLSYITKAYIWCENRKIIFYWVA